jgi:mono/diheme cytochrome c family protein
MRALQLLVVLGVSGVAISNAAGGARAAAPSPATGKRIFQTAGCAACHTLAGARATGKIGPNLDR